MEKTWKISIVCFDDNKRNLDMSEMTLEEVLMIAKANDFINLKWINGVGKEITETHSCRIFQFD